jgi:hypothetical protein
MTNAPSGFPGTARARHGCPFDQMHPQRGLSPQQVKANAQTKDPRPDHDHIGSLDGGTSCPIATPAFSRGHSMKVTV